MKFMQQLLQLRADMLVVVRQTDDSVTIRAYCKYVDV